MIKAEIMLFSERMHFAEVLVDWRDAQMNQMGWKVKDKDRLKLNYMDCISLLEGHGIIDIKKAREFVKKCGGLRMYIIKKNDEVVAVAYSGIGALTKLDAIIDGQNLTLEEAKEEYKKYTIEFRSKEHEIIESI